MSASLIGRLGSSAFRLSTTAVVAVSILKDLRLRPRQDIAALSIRAEESSSWFTGRHGGHLGSRAALGLLKSSELETAKHLVTNVTLGEAIDAAGQPNRGAKVASLQFVDVVDHYEAMDIFLPVTCHFAAVRRTAEDLAAITQRLKDLRQAIAEKDSEAMIHTNYDFHVAIAAACHNRSLAKAYSKMLVDKLRVAQHGIRGSEQKRDRSLAGRFRGTLRISEELLRAIADGDGKAAENLARELNTYARQQVIELLSANLSEEIDLPYVTSKGTEILERSSGAAWPLGGKRLNARS